MTETIVEELPIDVSEWWNQITAGADWQTSIYAMDDNEEPDDTTGWAMEIKFAKLDGTVLKTLSVGSGIVNNASDGRFDVTYAAADTVLLKVEEVKVSVKVTDDAIPAQVQYWYVANLPVFYPL
jgi:hypothetical protein